LNIVKRESGVKGFLFRELQAVAHIRQPHMPQSVGKRIADARRKLGVLEGRDLLAPELAKRLGVSSESVYNWESDATVPSEASMVKLAAILGVTPAYLRYGVTEPGRAIDRTVEEAEGQTPELLHEKAPARKASAKKTGRKAG
jgi:transcriptional regulator with XRE-family HTH domain